MFRVLGRRGGAVHDRGRLADFLSLLVWLTATTRSSSTASATRPAGIGGGSTVSSAWLTVEVGAALLASLLIVALAPFADSIFAHGAGLEKPLLVAALLPPLQALESIAAATLILNGRYDLRGIWLTISIGLRLAGIWSVRRTVSRRLWSAWSSRSC